MYDQRGIVPISLVSVIIAGAFTATGFLFATRSGAFFQKQTMPSVLFGKDIEAVVSTLYAAPEDLYITYWGPEACSYNSKAQDWECANDITVENVRLSTGYTKDAAVVGFPFTTCIFIELIPLVMKGLRKAGVTEAVNNKIDELLTASRRAEIAGEAKTLKMRLAEAFHTVRRKLTDYGLEEVFGSALKKNLEEYGGPLGDVASSKSSKELTEEILKRGEKLEEAGEISEEALDLGKKSIKEADPSAISAYGYMSTENFRRELSGTGTSLRRLSDVSEEAAEDALRKSGTDFWRYSDEISGGGSSWIRRKWDSFKEMAYKFGARSKTVTKYSVLRGIELASCKEQNCILPPRLSKFLGSEGGEAIGMILNMGPMLLLRFNLGYTSHFYDQYIGKYGYINIEYGAGTEDEDSNYMFVPNAEDMAFIANTITDKNNETDYRLRSEPLDFSGGKITFEKHKALFDTIVGEENKYYSNGLMEILHGIGETMRTGETQKFLLYVNPGRMIYQDGSEICEKKVARNVYGGKEGEFEIFCYDLPFEVDTSGFQKRLQVDHATCLQDKYFLFSKLKTRANTYHHQHGEHFYFTTYPQIWGLGWIPQFDKVNKIIKKVVEAPFKLLFNRLINFVLEWTKKTFKKRKYAFPESRYDKYQITISKENGEIKLSSTYKGPVIIMNQNNVYTEETGFPPINRPAYGCVRFGYTWQDMYECHRMSKKIPYIPGCSKGRAMKEAQLNISVPQPSVPSSVI